MPDLPLAEMTDLDLLTRADHAIKVWLSPLGRTGELFARLVLAGLLGGAVGLEREVRGREAGFRTFLLVAVGSALAMAVSESFAFRDWPGPTPARDVVVDPARVAYGVMTGIGFLGAGAILRRKDHVEGLTTAAGIWATAAVGLAAGLGLYVLSIAAGVLILVTLVGLKYVHGLLPHLRHKTLVIGVPFTPDADDLAATWARDTGVRIRGVRMERDPGSGRATVHLRLTYVGKERFLVLRQSLHAREGVEILKVG